ncbi:hypothetical protein ILYODFUR_032968 [Ilyodon furcidens]|uniref:Uncharacterized protein n=1 Tax=Ilyodon furcidens TaxID=33524 RepID=A0ABV0TE74_9TELE
MAERLQLLNDKVQIRSKGEYAKTKKQRTLRKKICNMIEKDMMPISMVDGGGFCDLMHLMEPSFNISSRATITTRLEARYKKAAELNAQLRAQSVALTTDCCSNLK